MKTKMTPAIKKIFKTKVGELSLIELRLLLVFFGLFEKDDIMTIRLVRRT